MNRSTTLSLTLAAAFAAQLALSACSKHEPVSSDVGGPSTSASAPDAMASSAVPMDSISSASAVAGSASDAAMAASDAASR
jgi:hypothetical protein